MAGLGAAPLDDHAGAGLHEGAVPLFLEGGEETSSAARSARWRAPAGWPMRARSDRFRFFESIPPERLAAAASSETVMPRRRRSWRTCTPIACSRVMSDTPAALEPVAYSSTGGMPACTSASASGALMSLAVFCLGEALSCALSCECGRHGEDSLTPPLCRKPLETPTEMTFQRRVWSGWVPERRISPSSNGAR